jgi:uncharacterized membrane protein
MLRAMAFTLSDFAALGFFVLCWGGYHVAMDHPRFGKVTLNRIMHDVRRQWMERMIRREVRIVDTQIMGSLQNGTAFFASTSIFAIGGTLALLRSADDLARILSDLPLASPISGRGVWEIKVAGLLVIFVYAFFKFSWAYRLFNYTAILIGSAPPFEDADTPRARCIVDRAADMATAAGRHFNRGQRAFFFALAYLGWFVSPLVLVLTTAAVLAVMSFRQYGSDARAAVLAGDEP